MRANALYSFCVIVILFFDVITLNWIWSRFPTSRIEPVLGFTPNHTNIFIVGGSMGLLAIISLVILMYIWSRFFDPES
ncbi:hypothetical protein HYT01_02255 [Candidatus Giovannonibacteria bacterium]|nr:hypothetical protein [Candidatus Giovannonibacteria bacterium]